MDFYDPNSGAAPVMGQKYLTIKNTNGIPYVVAETWSGKLNQGDQFLTSAQAQQQLQKNLAGAGKGAGTMTFQGATQLLNEFNNKTGSFDPTYDKNLSTNYAPGASTPSIANFSAAGQAAYVSPEQGLAAANAGGGTSAYPTLSGGSPNPVLQPPPTQPFASATVSTAQPPSVQLQRGDTGVEVKKLQDYLVATINPQTGQPYMTQAQVNTGYGTFGPQTEAAVAAMQKVLGVDTSKGGVGRFGPLTIAKVASIGGGGGPTGIGGDVGGGGTPGTGIGGGGPTGTGGGGPIGIEGMSAADRAELQKIIDNPNLSADQRAAIQSITGAVVSGDKDKLMRLQAAMTSATTYSDPYFKAQVRLATDALSRAISGKEGDLAFEKAQRERAIKDLNATSEYLTLEQQNEMKQLKNKYETEVNTLQDNMAAAGFTSSTRRARSEQILSEQNQGLVESSDRTLAYKQGNIASQRTDLQATIANLQRQAEAGNLDALRQTEEKVGSKTLSDLGYGNLLPGDGVGGAIPRQQALDAFQFASNFVY